MARGIALFLRLPKSLATALSLAVDKRGEKATDYVRHALIIRLQQEKTLDAGTREGVRKEYGTRDYRREKIWRKFGEDFVPVLEKRKD